MHCNQHDIYIDTCDNLPGPYSLVPNPSVYVVHSCRLKSYNSVFFSPQNLFSRQLCLTPTSAYAVIVQDELSTESQRTQKYMKDNCVITL